MGSDVASQAPALEVVDLHAAYGTSRVLFGVSFSVAPGAALAVLGRNGVGKTTLLAGVANLGPAVRGAVRVDGEPITGLAPYEIARRGVCLVPAERNIFPSLTTEQNLRVPAPGRASGDWTLDRVYALFPPLAERSQSQGWQLSGGEQQMLAIARALIMAPRVLLLDEPAEGLAPVVVTTLVEALRTVLASGVTVLVAEQNVGFCRALAGRGLVLDKGEIVHEGDLGGLLGDERVLATLAAGPGAAGG